MRFGLRTKLLLWTLCAVNVAFLSVWLISTTTARQGMVALAETNLGLGAQNLADAVAQLINDSYADGLTTSRLDLSAQAIETGDPKNIAWYSDEMVQQKGRYTAIVVADKNGKIIAANTVARDGKKLPSPLVGRSLGDLPWAQAALGAPKGHGEWVPPSKPAFLADIADGDGVVGYCFPIFDILDERIGTLTVLLSLASVGKQLDGYVTGDNGTESAAIVVDAAGTPVALPMTLADRERWRALEIRSQSVGQASFLDPNGAAYFVVERPIRGAAGEVGWRVAAMKTSAALEAPVDQIGDRLLWAFSIAVLATTALLVLAANRLVGPIQELTRATQSIGKASEYKPQPVRTADEVGVLTSSFNDLFKSLREHEEGLESKVAERTRDLEIARHDLADILDNMRQGIFTVDADGRVGSEFSAFTTTMFEGQTIAGADAVSLLQVVEQGDRSAATRMRFWFENIFGTTELQWILASEEGLKEIVYRPKPGGEDRHYQLEYAPVFKDGVIAKIMVIAKDVTEVRSLERAIFTKERFHQRNLARIAEIAAMDAGLFATFVDESRVLLSRADAAVRKLDASRADRQAIDEVFRSVHTLKGNARIFHITTIQELAHDVEESFQELRDLDLEVSDDALGAAKVRIAALHAEFDEIEKLGRQVLFGDALRHHAGPTVSVAESRLLDLRRRYKDLARALPGAAAHAEIEKLGSAVQTLTYVPLGELFDRFRKEVFDLGRETGKPMNDLEVVGADISVDAKLASKLREVLMHAIRNAIGHGIEQPAVRRAAGKPEKGTVKLEAAWQGGELCLSLSDDGAGFDIDRIKRRALSRRLIAEERADSMSDTEALSLSFLPGVTTSDNVSEVSGRGVGMDVVRSVMSGLNGSANVVSHRGLGSTLVLRIPASTFEPAQ